MYRYTDFDRRFVHQRAAQFRDQLERHLDGRLGEDEFKALRLQNGWYVQRHAPMLRVAVPYGELSAKQLRALARVAREYDGRDDGPYAGKGGGFGHFSTRQNCQFNWIDLKDAADVMDLLADADLHGIQTSGNCIRNITSDCFAGVAADEIVDPRPYCEILRQWSTLHPEFAFLPRKFKIAVSGAREDRAATFWHDIGLQLKKDDAGEIGFEVRVGGGMGRTPTIAVVIREFLPWQQILSSSKPSSASTTDTAGATTSTRHASRSSSRPKGRSSSMPSTRSFATSSSATSMARRICSPGPS